MVWQVSLHTEAYRRPGMKSELTTERLGQLIDLLEHSRKMLRLAEEGQWEEVISGEKQRRELVESFFSAPTSIKESYEVSRFTHEMLSINEHLQNLAMCARDMAGEELGAISLGRKAVSAYGGAMQNTDR